MAERLAVERHHTRRRHKHRIGLAGASTDYHGEKDDRRQAGPGMV
jgi:hypothetical protein